MHTLQGLLKIDHFPIAVCGAQSDPREVESSDAEPRGGGDLQILDLQADSWKQTEV